MRRALQALPENGSRERNQSHIWQLVVLGMFNLRFGHGVPHSRNKLTEHDRTASLGTLTSLEREVLTLLVQGCTTKQAAARLGVDFKTVECHRERLMAKLGAREVTDLVFYAIRKKAGVVVSKGRARPPTFSYRLANIPRGGAFLYASVKCLRRSWWCTLPNPIP
jgi:DNA-binding CsgD family transcriptional regulator